MTKPFDLFGSQRDKDVVVRLRDGTDVTGTLESFDVHINLVLKNARNGKEKYSSIFIRGATILYVSPADKE